MQIDRGLLELCDCLFPLLLSYKVSSFMAFIDSFLSVPYCMREKIKENVGFEDVDPSPFKTNVYILEYLRTKKVYAVSVSKSMRKNILLK